MLYVGFDTTGKVLKITNEPDNILQYLEISAEMFEKFADAVENLDDYIVVKKQDYVLEKKIVKKLYQQIFFLCNVQKAYKKTVYILYRIKN